MSYLLFSTMTVVLGGQVSISQDHVLVPTEQACTDARKALLGDYKLTQKGATMSVSHNMFADGSGDVKREVSCVDVGEVDADSKTIIYDKVTDQENAPDEQAKPPALAQQSLPLPSPPQTEYQQQLQKLRELELQGQQQQQQPPQEQPQPVVTTYTAGPSTYTPQSYGPPPAGYVAVPPPIYNTAPPPPPVIPLHSYASSVPGGRIVYVSSPTIRQPTLQKRAWAESTP